MMKFSLLLGFVLVASLAGAKDTVVDTDFQNELNMLDTEARDTDVVGTDYVLNALNMLDTEDEELEARSESCLHSAQLDLQLIVDTSGSVGKTRFHKMMKDIAEKVVGGFEIGPKKTRVGLFKYSSKLVNVFDLDKYSNMKSLKAATAAVKFLTGSTRTGSAMKAALVHFTKKMRKDSKTAKICLVFTDGKANKKDAPIIPGITKKWAKAGVTVFAVGIGKGISKKGLVDIAGNEKHALQVKDFNELAKFAKKLLVKVCETIEEKTEEKTVKTGEILKPKSKEGKEKVNVHFINKSNKTVDAFWIDYKGKEKKYRTLAPGQGYVQITYVTHPWVFKDKSGNIMFASVGNNPNLYKYILPPAGMKGLPVDVFLHGQGATVVREVTITGGHAGASSWASKWPIHAPSSAFGKNSPAQGWAASGSPANQVVFYQFPAPILVTRFTIGNRADGYIEQSPKKIQLVGTNDADCKASSSWQTVFESPDFDFTGLGQVKAWDVPAAQQMTFGCWGIKTLKTKGKGPTIRGIRMWTKVLVTSITASDHGELGCFKDKGTRDLDGAHTDIKDNTPGKCIEYCRSRGFAYAGVQYTRQCFCGKSYGRYGKADASQCNKACPGNAQLKCGGSWHQNVYATEAPTTEAPTTEAPITEAPITEAPITEAPICATSQKMDIQLIVDSSGSVGKKHFKEQLAGLADDLFTQFKIGKDKTQFALYRFAFKANSKSIYQLNSFTDLVSLQKATKATPYAAGPTFTAYAMKESLKLFKQNSRKDAVKVCLVFTDGKANDAKDLESARNLWEKEGIKVYAIGLGKNINKKDLATISGDDNRALLSEEFSRIGEIMKPLLKTIC